MSELVRAVRGNTRPIWRGKDYTDQTIGSWTVLGPITCERVGGTQNYKTRWLCQCSCGAEPSWVIKENLTRGTSRGCLKCYGTRTTGGDNPNWKGHADIPGEVFQKIRFGAKARNIDLKVDLVDLHAQWVAQEQRCALTGLQLTMGEDASLDRIDSAEPYCVGNIQWVHKTINIMKNHFSEEEFIDMCVRVVEHRKT